MGPSEMVRNAEAGKPAAAAVFLRLFQHQDLFPRQLRQLYRGDGAAGSRADDHHVCLLLDGRMGRNPRRFSRVDGADIADLHAPPTLDTFLRVDLIFGPLVVDGVDGTFQGAVVTPQAEGFDRICHMLSPYYMFETRRTFACASCFPVYFRTGSSFRQRSVSDRAIRIRSRISRFWDY